ncbi:PleD family two-component system response regulator [Thiomicrospira sp. ALE5]|uniref:response regulator n=1 Tax=Thiomicrospira sp. ALE5 TaxID=748650 RepID=UPI0008EF7DFE|nr:response regulator [Thiomicrospira sp. ALE5]SFR51509.1 two-component system, chemotaxis family, response regulator CheY [Thiomicrospira sp. ALE5]
MLEKPKENTQLSILLVDDTPQMCSLISSFLYAEGYRKIAILNSPEKALQILQKRPFDLILLDNNMPNLSGVDLLTQVKPLPHLAASKFMMITADTASSIVQTAIKAGADDFIVKPFNAKTLAAKISRLVPNS